MWELICPACGALIEEPDIDALEFCARSHTLDAHSYDVPRKHVIDAAREIPEPGNDTATTARRTEK